MTELFQNKYRIESARLKGWDYGSNRYYFVTICTNNRTHFFGRIQNDIMCLNEIGTIAYQCWLEIPNHFPFVVPDEFVIMPNHVHGIVHIDKNTHHAIVEIEIVAALFEHEAARVVLEAAPIAHEEGAVIGRDMLAGFDGDDIAENVLGLRLAEVLVERRIAQHETDHDAIGAVFAEEFGERHRVLDRGHHRLLSEYLEAAREAGANVFEMKVVV